MLIMYLLVGGKKLIKLKGLIILTFKIIKPGDNLQEYDKLLVKVIS